MPRGRPKKVAVPLPTEKEITVATYLAKVICTIPGCEAKNHVDDAKELIKLIRE